MMYANRSGIYEIVNRVNGKRYIGSAISLSRRSREHMVALERGKHANQRLQNSWNKHGASAFQIRTLIRCDPKDLLMFEQRAMDAFAPEYNISKRAGNTLGVKRTPEQIAKTVRAKTGIPLTAEHKAKLSAALKGRVFTDEERAKISAGLRNKPPCSAATRAAIPAAHKGRKLSPEHCAKLSAARRGVKRGPRKPKDLA